MSARQRKAPPIVDAREWLDWEAAIQRHRAGESAALIALIEGIQGPDNARRFLAGLADGEACKLKRGRGCPTLSPEERHLSALKQAWFKFAVYLERVGMYDFESGEEHREADQAAFLAALDVALKMGVVKSVGTAIETVADATSSSVEKVRAGMYGKQKRKAPR